MTEWKPIGDAPREAKSCLLRMLDDSWCIGRWSPDMRGWLLCSDSVTVTQQRLYPTHYCQPPQEREIPDAADQAFQVYDAGRQGPDDAIAIDAADPYAAALKFVAASGRGSFDTRISVISANGIESLFGYRQTIPQAHLDD